MIRLHNKNHLHTEANARRAGDFAMLCQRQPGQVIPCDNGGPGFFKEIEFWIIGQIDHAGAPVSVFDDMALDPTRIPSLCLIHIKPFYTRALELEAQ